MLANFVCFCRLLTFFFKINFFQKKISNTTRVSTDLDPDQDQHSVGPDLGPNCLQKLSANDKVTASKERLNIDQVTQIQHLCHSYRQNRQ